MFLKVWNAMVGTESVKFIVFLAILNRMCFGSPFLKLTNNPNLTMNTSVRTGPVLPINLTVVLNTTNTVSPVEPVNETDEQFERDERLRLQRVLLIFAGILLWVLIISALCSCSGTRSQISALLCPNSHDRNILDDDIENPVRPGLVLTQSEQNVNTDQQFDENPPMYSEVPKLESSPPSYFSEWVTFGYKTDSP